MQVGAFHSETNATNVLKKIDTVGQGRVSRINRDGQVLHRVRLGPINEVGDADKLLSAYSDITEYTLDSVHDERQLAHILKLDQDAIELTLSRADFDCTHVRFQ